MRIRARKFQPQPRYTQCKGIDPAAQGWRPKSEISFSDSHGRAISAPAISQGHLCGPCAAAHQSAPEKTKALSRYPRIMGSYLLHRAGCSYSKSASQTVLRGYLALAISQGHLCCPCTPISTQKGRGFFEIPAIQGVAPVELSRMLTFSSCRHNLIFSCFSKFFLVY